MYFYGKYAVVVDMADWKKNWDSDWERLCNRIVAGHNRNEFPPTEDEFPMYLRNESSWDPRGCDYFERATKEEFAAAYKKYREAEEAEFKAVDKLLGKS